MYQTYPIDVIDQSYTSRSLPLSAQVTRNLYPEIVTTGKTQKALHTIAGKKLFSTGSGSNRGCYRKEWYGNKYTVNGTTLYKVNSSGTQTGIGTISGSGRCVFESSENYLYIVTGGRVFRSDGVTVSQVVDPSLESPNSIAFINTQMVYDGAYDKFWVSNAGDGGTLNALNFAFAQSSPDDLIRVYQFRQQIIMFGADSLEPWYNTGQGNPPMDRVEGALRPVGIAGVHCVTNTPAAVYFLANDRTVYRIEGYEPVQVSTVAINNAIESYTTVSDCFAYSYKFQGQNFVVFTFPTANKTWAFLEESNAWVELSSGVNGGRDIANGYCYAFGKHLLTDYRNGNIYELDIDTFSDNGAEFIRERVIRPISAIDIDQPGKRILMSRFELIIETGIGLATGQGSDPAFMFSYSVDGGRTWSAETWVSPGNLGAYTKKVEYYCFASGHDILIKFRISDPIKVSIHAASADLMLAGY